MDLGVTALDRGLFRRAPNARSGLADVGRLATLPLMARGKKDDDREAELEAAIEIAPNDEGCK